MLDPNHKRRRDALIDDEALMNAARERVRRRIVPEIELALVRYVLDRLMAEGVTFISPETTLVDADVGIGPDTVLYPAVLIEGNSTVGAASVIGPFSRIIDSHVGRGGELVGWNFRVGTTVPNGSIVKAYVRQGAD